MVKRTVSQQYQAFADQTAAQAAAQRLPRLVTVRRALGMSGEQLGRRMGGLTRARVSQIELAETSGTATLKSMQAMAEAMGCRFVYAIVPPGTFEDLIAAQARKKAESLVEGQKLSKNQMAEEVEKLAREIAHKMPSDLWDDE
jgi:predicted DNA-binding mobile mystery protein A